MILLVFSILFITEILYIQFAKNFNIFDVTNDRSSHNIPVIRGGGIIFWIAVLIYFVGFDFNYPYFFIGLTLVSFISFWDDVASLPISYRLFIHFIGTGLLLIELNYFSNNLWLILLVFILIMGTINASNFMDGINGMTAGNSIVVIGSLWFINSYHLKFIDENYIVYIFLSLVVFFFFNFRSQAICFAGDVGSISIGFIISFLLMKLILKDNNPTYILFLSVYGVDSTLTILQRMILRENIFEPHRCHLFQIIVDKLKINHLIVSIIYMVIQLMICIILILNLARSPTFQLKIGILTITILTILYIAIKAKLTKIHS